LTDDNKELAANLRREVQQQQQQTKSRTAATSKSRKQGSELGSGRGSEERHSSVPAGGRGTKRSRDNDVEKVRHFLTHLRHIPLHKYVI
jgi:mortality factor 4-like protein 1